jgi:predicted RNase H-like HicB family nuclease
MQYKIKLIKSEEGFAAQCEDLLGCFSEGKTEEEAITNIKIAIQEYLEAKEELHHNQKSILIEV